MNQELKYSLEQLEMLGTSEYASGLVPVKDINSNRNLPPEEFIELENADKYGAHYVYFRKFENRPSVAQVYLYDFTDKLGIKEDELTNLHKQLYSSGQVPMFFVFTKKDVRIFNCFERPARGKNLKYTPLTTIKIASDLSEELDSQNQEEFKAFSGRSFDNGTFWENSKYSNQFKFSNSAYEKLLTELKQALKDIITQDILPANFARKIMVVSILIKYLEEREDEKGNKVFPENFFSRFSQNATKFTDVLNQTGAYLELLNYLADHFNGGIFQLEDDERKFIANTDLSRFGQFLDGETEGIQFVFWRLYSFNDLPVELISNIYEEFLGKQPGVVYTPPYLVNFLLDEAMPLSNEETDFKILDPACGSGVFLVGAYRRLIYRWRKKNNWTNPDLETLKKLLRENIYGVELKKEAADLTIFSLSLALCDELTPLQIWKDLRFDDLHKENILHDDFFNIVSDKKLQKQFDLIIGNPPFEAKLTEAAKRIETIKSRERKISVLLDDNKTEELPVKLPDNQIALLFLEQSVELCKEKGLVCLIQPSGPLLYNNSSFQFRQVLLKKYNIPQIIDFTHISRVLFGKNGDVATAAIFIKNESSKENGLLHVTVRRTKPHKEKLYFELDTYDFHHVPFNLAYSDSLIWKSNFLGGHRHHQIIQRLSKLSTFEDFLIKQKDENGWAYSEGFTAAIKSDIKKLDKLKSERFNSYDSEESYQKELSKLEAPFLTGKKHLPVEAFSSLGVDESQIEESLNLQYFHSKGDPKIYDAPHLLIKEIIESSSFSIPVTYRNDDLVFKNSIYGIHGHSEEALLEVKNRFSNNQLFPYYLAGISGRFMVNKSSSLLATDIKNLPFPEDHKEIELNDSEKTVVKDFVEYLIEFRRNGEKSRIAIQDASIQHLSDFGDTYCNVLRSIYKSITPFRPFETDSYICFPFYFGEKPDIDFTDSEQAEKHLEKLVQKNSGLSLRLTRIVRLYEGNVIYLIKPKKLRYWLKSIALRDADETFSDLRKQGF
ncbi:HsdM family class I SAM-dependent methyltransferase [Altibacter sp. HG106]|uniref:HsdM family class I SAM-dependent methyltransferase n=1 Tax=Altibacter sp. HG106 TaxID=3023937 RepID=UPI002350153F|nr:N-6 DNA methylase [Altibacter sp. HG106]MDC7996334.1 N-6 DNA methylase [Altibacter sp. HG106]